MTVAPYAPTPVRNSVPSVHRLSIGRRGGVQSGVWAGGSIGKILLTATNPTDTETVTITNGVTGTAVIFEFDDDDSVTAGRVLVAIGATSASTAVSLARAIRASIVQCSADIDPADPNNVIVINEIPGSGGDGAIAEGSANITTEAFADGHDELIGIFELETVKNANGIPLDQAQGMIFGEIVNESPTDALVFSVQESDTLDAAGFTSNSVAYRSLGASVATTLTIQPGGRALYVIEPDAARMPYLRFVASPNTGGALGTLTVCHWTGRLAPREELRPV